MKRLSGGVAVVTAMLLLLIASPASAARSRFGITWGTVECYQGGTITIGFPLIGDTGLGKVWTQDVLYARRESGGSWEKAGYSALWWNRDNRPIFDWYKYRTGQVGGSGTMWQKRINPGWYAGIYQYVKVRGRWYRSPFRYCTF